MPIQVAAQGDREVFLVGWSRPDEVLPEPSSDVATVSAVEYH